MDCIFWHFDGVIAKGGIGVHQGVVKVLSLFKSLQSFVIGNIDFFPGRYHKYQIVPVDLARFNKLFIIGLSEKIHIGKHIGNTTIEKTNGDIGLK